jgi:phosphotransferase system enzyme I (PtsP)
MLATLRRIIQEISSADDFQEALKIMAKRTATALETQACSIFLIDKNRTEFVLQASFGLYTDAVGKVTIPLNKGLVGLILEREQPLNIQNAEQHPRFYKVPEINESFYKAFLGVPIIYHRQVLGVVVVQHHEPRRYDEAEEAFLATLVAQFGAVVAHAEAVGNLYSGNEILPDTMFSGISGAPGIGIGRGVVIIPLFDFNAIPDFYPTDMNAEIALLTQAIEHTRSDLRLMGEKLSNTIPEEERALFDAYEGLLDDSSFTQEIILGIQKGNWAKGALREVVQMHMARLNSLENEYLRERASDIADLGHRILVYLQQEDRNQPQYKDNTILVGEELTATHLADVPEGLLTGIVSLKGSSNSHVAILARAMGVPTVMGVANIFPLDLQDEKIIVDGFSGQIYINPSLRLLQEFELLAKQESDLDATLEIFHDKPAATSDGHRIILMVNTGLGRDVSLALSAGAEGVGLYRTEVPFLIRDRFPTGEEQRILYRQLLMSFYPHPVTMRTLDIGGDKALSYFPVKEDNPFLGWRGIRISLDHPDIFLQQLRAMLRASEGLHNLRVMFPMITDVVEADEALRLLNKAYQEVLDENYDIEMPQVGVMIEVPSAVYQARALAKRFDFLSVGSNDLTQYILAVDRNNPRVANLYDPFNSSVLKALMQVVEAGHKEGKHVSICGELAANPLATILLIGMGFDSLSLNAAAITRIKWVLSHFTQTFALKVLHTVLSLESAAAIRQTLEDALQTMGLQNLIRTKRV